MSGRTSAVNGRERSILRDLARHVAEVARLPIQEERADLWRRHNHLHAPVRPMVLIFPEGAWREMLPEDDLECTDPSARSLERDLRTRLYYHQHIPAADHVIEAVMPSPMVMPHSGWGIKARVTRPEQATGAEYYESVLETEADIDSIRLPDVSVDHAATERQCDMLSDLFDGILTVEKQANLHNAFAGMDLLAIWRGVERLLWDLADRPEFVHRAMERICEGAIRCHEAVIASGMPTLNNRNHYTGSGGTGYTRQLPQPDFNGVHVRSKDLWGFATAQIFSEVSPRMHDEFALEYERRFLSRFGLSSYGCCEPLHNKLEIVKKIPNLRRVSISPFADIRKSAEGLGNSYIYSWKPSPAVVAGESWDPAFVRAQTENFLDITRGCVVEIVMKDTHTCRNHPQRMWEWAEIARDAAEARA